MFRAGEGGRRARLPAWFSLMRVQPTSPPPLPLSANEPDTCAVSQLFSLLRPPFSARNGRANMSEKVTGFFASHAGRKSQLKILFFGGQSVTDTFLLVSREVVEGSWKG